MGHHIPSPVWTSRARRTGALFSSHGHGPPASSLAALIRFSGRRGDPSRPPRAEGFCVLGGSST